MFPSFDLKQCRTSSFQAKGGMLATLGFLLAILVSLMSMALPVLASDQDDLARQLKRQAEYNEKVARLHARYPHTELYNVTKRRKVGLNRIFEFESSPLGERYPLVLVPGRAEEFQQNSWWKKFYHLIHDNSEFNKHFKLYVYIYDSKQPLRYQALDFDAEMQSRFGELPKERKAILITYSLGGMISLNALRDSEIFDRVHAMFAIAVPFHGSPIFDHDWFSEYLRSPNRSPIRTFWDRFIYRAYLFDKTNLTEGLRWNNFDNSQPKFNGHRLELKGDQALHGDTAYVEDDYIQALKQKTIIYASYLENGYTRSNQPLNPLKLPRFVLDKSAKLPKELVGTVLPLYGTSVHSVFTYMNNQLANIATFTPEHPEGKNTNLYRFNDGAIPLSSMLWLPKRTEPYSDDFEQLVEAANVRKVRVFVNLDHMHIGDYGLRDARKRAQDIVHPNDGERVPNRWLLHDVMSLLPELQTVALHEEMKRL